MFKVFEWGVPQPILHTLHQDAAIQEAYEHAAKCARVCYVLLDGECIFYVEPQEARDVLAFKGGE